MDMEKIQTINHRLITLFSIFCLALPVTVSAQSEQWINLTSFRNIRSLKVIDGRIYSATAGGLQIFASPQSKPEVLLNADGLGTVDLYDVMSDNAGTIWVAGNGRLAKIVDQQVSSYLLLDRDNEELPLYRLADDVDFIWIGSDLGLLLFSKTNDEGQIQESYSLFDNLCTFHKEHDELQKLYLLHYNSLYFFQLQQFLQ